MRKIARLSLIATAALFGGCSSTNSGSADTASAGGPSANCCAPTESAPSATAAAPAASGAYPLTTCPVSGEKLGDMGDFVTVSYEGVDVHLCCPGCKKAFAKDPKKYADMVTAARK